MVVISCLVSALITLMHFYKTEFTNIPLWSWGPSLFTCIRDGALRLRSSLINVVPLANWPLPNKENQCKLRNYWSHSESAAPHRHMPIRVLSLHAALRVTFIISMQTPTVELVCKDIWVESNVWQKRNCRLAY